MNKYLCVFLFSLVFGIDLTGQTLFGASVKNSELTLGKESTFFAHNCSLSPCTITQIHIPSIYSVDAWNQGRLRIYVDNETKASIDITLADLSFLGNLAVNGTRTPYDKSPWGIDLFGHTAKNGGVYSTIRIPFSKAIRMTIQPQPPGKPKPVFWAVVRGIEGLPVIVGDFTLPDNARLNVQSTSLQAEPFQLFDIAKSKNPGILLGIQYDAECLNCTSFLFLEACLRLYVNGNPDPMFLSSGVEDYFLSSSYFDEGEFITPNSGLTFKAPGKISAFKTHTRDPVIWSNGMRFVWRNSEQSQGCGSPELCPRKFCPPGYKCEKSETATVAESQDLIASYNIKTWYYSWEKSTKQSNAEVLRSMELPLAREIELQRLLLNKDAALMKLFDLYEDDLKTLRKILM